MNRVLVGFHGKLPGVGDFVQRRLPAVFVDRWDTAMQSALPGAADALGESWKERVLAAPAWRFVLARHVCGPLPWAGVVTSSQDRVGRVFPLVLAASPAIGENGWPRLPGHAWFAALDHAMERSREAISVSMFDAVVAMLPDPSTKQPDAVPPASTHARSYWWRGNARDEGIAFDGLPGADDYLRLLGVDRQEESV
ncbi:MAG: type VI secretion system-associated protein TagF [Luteibacter sp.]